MELRETMGWAVFFSLGAGLSAETDLVHLTGVITALAVLFWIISLLKALSS